jgi:hypothetical protein
MTAGAFTQDGPIAAAMASRGRNCAYQEPHVDYAVSVALAFSAPAGERGLVAPLDAGTCIGKSHRSWTSSIGTGHSKSAIGSPSANRVSDRLWPTDWKAVHMGATGTDISACCRRVLSLGHYLDLPMGLLAVADASNVEIAHEMAEIAFADGAMREPDISDDRDLVRMWRLFERELRSLTGPDAGPERRTAVAPILLACKSRIAIAEGAAADLMVRDGCSALLASARAHETAFDRLAEALSTIHCANHPFAADMSISPPTQGHPAEVLASSAKLMQIGGRPDPGHLHASLRGLMGWPPGNRRCVPPFAMLNSTVSRFSRSRQWPSGPPPPSPTTGTACRRSATAPPTRSAPSDISARRRRLDMAGPAAADGGDGALDRPGADAAEG